MSGPWDNYQPPSQAAGPWTQYAAPQAPPTDPLVGAQGLSGDALSRYVGSLSAQQKRAYVDAIRARAKSGPDTPVGQQVANQVVSGLPWYQKLGAGVGEAYLPIAREIGRATGIESANAAQNGDQLENAITSTIPGKIGDYGAQAVQSALPIGAAARGMKLLQIGGRFVPVAASAIGSGVQAAMQPADSLAQRGVNALAGAGMGAAGEGIARALGGAAARAGTAGLSLAKREGIALADKLGIPLHLSQTTDSKPLQILASTTKYLPFSGAASAARKQQAAFNNAIAGTFGESGDALTPDLMGRAGSRLGDAYDRFFATHEVPLDNQALADITDIQTRGARDLTPDQQRILGNQVNAYLDAAGNNFRIPGELYQNTRKAVGNVVSSDPQKNYLVDELKGAMERAASRADPDGTLADLNRQYSNMKVAQRALKRVAGAGYDISPATLYSATQGKFGATPEMQALARMGQTVLKDPIPDSGTAQRYLTYGALGGFGFHNPLSAASMLASGPTIGRFLNSNAAAHAVPAVTGAAMRGAARVSRLLPYFGGPLAPPLVKAGEAQ